MKRTILLAMMVSLFAVSAYAQKAPKRQGYISEFDQDQLSFKGDVAEVTILRINYKSHNENDIKDTSTSTYKFNKRGDVIESDINMLLKSRHKHIYNADGRMIKTLIYDDNKLTSYTLHLYGANGKIIEDRVYRANEKTLFSRTRYKYDANGNQTSKIRTGNDGEIYHKQSYRYDSKNRMIEHTCVINEEEPDEQYNEYFVYDAKGNLIESRFRDLNSKYFHQTINKYDSKDRKIETLEYYQFDKGYQSRTKTTYKYDAYNNIVEEVEYNDKGALSYKTTRNFNSYKNLIEETKYDGSGAISYKYCYKYDANQNKIESTKYDKNGELEYKLLMKYDSKNRKIEELVYNKADVLLEKSCWAYDHMDNEIEKSFYDYRKDPVAAISKLVKKIVYRQ